MMRGISIIAELIFLVLLISSSRSLFLRRVTSIVQFSSSTSRVWNRDSFVNRGKYLPRSNSSCKLSADRAPLNSEPLELCEENAVVVIDEVRRELGTIFGYDPMSRQVGITGEIDLVEVDGPTVVVSLKGRFWHATDTVMLRVESFIKNRIPEVLEVKLDLARSVIRDDNRLNTEGSGERRLF